MNLFTVSTLAGYKSHYAQDGQLRTLCGREVSNSTDGHDMCKACAKAAAKLTEARERLEYATRAAETQDDVMQAAPRDAEGTTYVEGCEVESVSRRNGRPLETGMVMRIEDGRPVVSFYGEGDELSDVRPDLFKITSMPVEPTYTPNEPVSVYATVKGETDEFEAAHIPNGNPADVDRWITWAQENPNWINVRAANYVSPVQCSEGHTVPTGEKAEKAERTGQSWDTFRDAADRAAHEAEMAAQFAASEAGDRMDAEAAQRAEDNEIGAQYDGEQDATPTLTLDMSAGRTVLVRLGDHTMTIKNGSDVRLRAAFWARGLGYRPEHGRALKWHRSGKTVTAPLAMV